MKKLFVMLICTLALVYTADCQCKKSKEAIGIGIISTLRAPISLSVEYANVPQESKVGLLIGLYAGHRIETGKDSVGGFSVGMQASGLYKLFQKDDTFTTNLLVGGSIDEGGAGIQGGLHFVKYIGFSKENALFIIPAYDVMRKTPFLKVGVYLQPNRRL